MFLMIYIFILVAMEQEWARTCTLLLAVSLLQTLLTLGTMRSQTTTTQVTAAMVSADTTPRSVVPKHSIIKYKLEYMG